MNGGGITFDLLQNVMSATAGEQNGGGIPPHTPCIGEAVMKESSGGTTQEVSAQCA